MVALVKMVVALVKRVVEIARPLLHLRHQRYATHSASRFNCCCSWLSRGESMDVDGVPTGKCPRMPRSSAIGQSTDTKDDNYQR